ncbi:hypothetical protein RHO15_09735 [Utexia brackfieldae]|uniref:hypothetical protein n=1 Tax=Utexia brackfieldae TaxID=3074108 RepID=UPI00370D032B
MSLEMLQRHYDNAVENFRVQDGIEAIANQLDEKLCATDIEEFIKSAIGSDAVVSPTAYKHLSALLDAIITDTANKRFYEV